MSIRVVLVDDHALFREALRMSLNLVPGITVVGEAGDAEAALRCTHECRPDVVCMDITLPDGDGVATTRALLAQNPELKVIGLSAHVDPVIARRLQEAGALAYVCKMDAGQELPTVIRKLTSEG